LSQLLSKVTVTILQFLYQMFNVSALLLDDALKPATPLIIDQWRRRLECVVQQQGYIEHLM